jgi:cytidine deaminase
MEPFIQKNQIVQKQVFQFPYESYSSSSELNEDDRKLLDAAQKATSLSYAPYSLFNVGAAARLINGEIITGGNQENASFPAGLCAEGVVLATASSQFPAMPIDTLAISYSSSGNNDHLIAPCGICRQSMQQFKERTGKPIRLIMGGQKGEVIIVADATYLLPFAFKF